MENLKLVHSETYSNKRFFNLCKGDNAAFTAEDFHIKITNNFSVCLGGIHFHGALIQGDAYRIVESYHVVQVQMIKAGFVVFSTEVPRNRRAKTLEAARKLHLVW